MAWLHGPAGGGKSAIAQTLGELCQKKGLLAATFFFSRTSSAERSDGERVIPTVVSELMRTFPELKPPIAKVIDDDPFLFSKTLPYQLGELLDKPLQSFQQSGDREINPRLIIFDGLDECNDQNVQIALIEAIASAIPRLAYPFCFLIVSRPEAHIVDAFNCDPLKAATTLRLDVSNDPSADGDIRLFLEDAFEGIHFRHRHRRSLPSPWPPQDTIDTLVKRSTGQFIYPSTAMKYVQSPKHLPHHRLRDIIGVSIPFGKENPFAPLDALYTFIFSCVEDENIEATTRFFSLLLATNMKIDFYLDRSVRPMERFLGLDRGQLGLILDPFLSLLVVSESEPFEIKVFHASLFDFLLNGTRAFPIHDLGLKINLSLGCEIAALYWWSKLEQNPSGVFLHFQLF